LDQEFLERMHNFMIWLGVAGAVVVGLIFVFYFYIKFKIRKKKAMEQ